MFAVEAFSLVFTIVTPGPYILGGGSKIFPAKSNVKVNCEKFCLW